MSIFGAIERKNINLSSKNVSENDTRRKSKVSLIRCSIKGGAL